MNILKLILFFPWFSFCLCDIAEETKSKILTEFLEYYNQIQNNNYVATDGNVISLIETNSSYYRLDVNFNERHDGKITKMGCLAEVQDLGEQGIAVNGDITCSHKLYYDPIRAAIRQNLYDNNLYIPSSEESDSPNESPETYDSSEERRPVNLENEIQADTAVTSGEQFIAVPRKEPTGLCEGCSSHVNLSAPGVTDLANLGVRHLDFHEPNFKHTLQSVKDVERQVQVTNGVRYTLLLDINSSNCTERDPCSSITTTCKIAILVKPWNILPNGEKYRSILSNNCTEEWLFGDNGEVLPEPNLNLNPSANDSSVNVDEIKVKHSEDTASQPNQDKTLTPDELKAIEDQIIPNETTKNPILSSEEPTVTNTFSNITDETAHYASETEYKQPINDTYVSVPEPPKQVSRYLSTDKKKAIDDLFDLFNFPNNQPNYQNGKSILRKKRSLMVDSKNENVRGKRQIPGRPTVQDPNDPRYKILAEESLKKYVLDNGIARPLRVLGIDKVTSGVVAGELIKIHFIGIPLGNAHDSSVLRCISEIWERLWLNKREIKVTCEIENIRDKRQIPGSPTVKDPNDPRYKTLAQESLNKYILENRITRPLRVIRIEKVTSQVVAGELIKIKFIGGPSGSSDSTVLGCSSEIWERSWLNKKEINVTCKNENVRSKRQIPGGPTEKDPNDPRYKTLAQASLNKYISENRITRPLRVVSIEKVTYQVVAGSLIKIIFIGGPSGSPDSSSVLRCSSEIWERPWLNKKEIKVTCENDNIRSKRQLVGGIVEKDPNDPRYKTLAEDSLKKYALDSGIASPLRVLRIDKVTNQLTAGELIKIHFIGGPSGYSYSSSVLRCVSVIGEQIWLNKREINVTCENENIRSKRQIPAFQMMNEKQNEKVLTWKINRQKRDLSYSKLLNKNKNIAEDDDPMKPEFQLMAAQALQKYSKKRRILYKVLEVKSVKKQVVAGFIYQINFSASPTECIHNVSKRRALSCKIIDNSTEYCFAKIWDQPWIRKKNINIRCSLPSIDSDYEDEGIESYSGKIENDKISDTLADNLVELTSSEEDFSKKGLPTKALALANEALEHYLSSENKKYVYRINEILSFKEQLQGTCRLEFLISPTLCLRQKHIDSTKNCLYKNPTVKYLCKAKIQELDEEALDKDIIITCKKKSDKSKIGNLLKRQADPTLNEINEIEVDKDQSHLHLGEKDVVAQLAGEVLKHIEIKYPNSEKLKIVRIFSLNEQSLANMINYKMKVEVGFTDCFALSNRTDCKLNNNSLANNFCSVNVWLRTLSGNPPSFRVSCDFQKRPISNLIQAEQLFQKFLITYNPSYVQDSTELQKRLAIFKDNIRKINELNINEKGTAIYGLTRFADLTKEEFRSQYLGLTRSLEDKLYMKEVNATNFKLAPCFDWRSYGAVTDVKDQLSCGSSWAFSVSGNIESLLQIKTQELLPLSEQQLLDCDNHNNGCNGGSLQTAYSAVEQLGGLQPESTYPYDAKSGECKFNKKNSKVQIKGAVHIRSDEESMAQWLVKNGPIAVGINAEVLQFYQRGIAHPSSKSCDPANLDHGALIVGYGIEELSIYNKKLPYWIIKNSWSKSWGEEGYFRLYRGDGTCGVNRMATSAVLST